MKYAYLSKNGCIFYTTDIRDLEDIIIVGSNNTEINKILNLKKIDYPVLHKNDNYFNYLKRQELLVHNRTEQRNKILSDCTH